MADRTVLRKLRRVAVGGQPEAAPAGRHRAARIVPVRRNQEGCNCCQCPSNGSMAPVRCGRPWPPPSSSNREKAMITGMHAIIYSRNADADRPGPVPDAIERDEPTRLDPDRERSLPTAAAPVQGPASAADGVCAVKRSSSSLAVSRSHFSRTPSRKRLGLKSQCIAPARNPLQCCT